jgi:hypothetical protein
MAKTKHRRVTIASLQRAGLPVVRGKVYVHREWMPTHRISLAALHRKLAMFRGSLAEEIARAREEG